MLNNIKMYVCYWLIMLSFYPYRKVFARDWLILKKSFKVLLHPDDYDSDTIAANYVLFMCTNTELRRKVDLFRFIKSLRRVK